MWQTKPPAQCSRTVYGNFRGIYAMTNEDEGVREGSAKVDCSSIPTSSWPFGEQYKGSGGTLDPHSRAAMNGSSTIVRTKSGRKRDSCRTGGRGRRFAD